MHKQITLASVVVCVLGLLAVPGALADRAYSDPAGDSGTAADVTAVRAAHDAAGTITFTAITNQPVLAPDATVYVYVDADRNPATGLAVRGLGADHFFSHDAEFGTGFVFHANGNFLIVDFTSTLATSYDAGTLTARINRSDLGNTEKFAFLIEAARDDENDATPDDADFAPDAAPFFEYSLFAVALTVGKPVGLTVKPVAGKRFALSAPVTRSDGEPFALGTVACRAKAGGVSLSVAGRIVNGSARCSMRIPKSAKGKTLRGSLTVSAEDVPAVSKPFAFRNRLSDQPAGRGWPPKGGPSVRSGRAGPAASARASTPASGPCLPPSIRFAGRRLRVRGGGVSDLPGTSHMSPERSVSDVSGIHRAIQLGLERFLSTPAQSRVHNRGAGSRRRRRGPR